MESVLGKLSQSGRYFTFSSSNTNGRSTHTTFTDKKDGSSKRFGESKPEEIAKLDHTVIACHLPQKFRERHMRQLFAPFGCIKKCRLMRFLDQRKIQSKGYGFVQFENMEQAMNAITHLNGKVVCGKI